jgi:murein tripeptide amidase MpaA
MEQVADRERPVGPAAPQRSKELHVRTLAVWSTALATTFALVATTPASAQQVRYDGHRVVRVDVRTTQELEKLLTMTDDVWSDGIGLGTLDVRVSPEQFLRLQESGLAYTVMIEDLQPLIEAERAPGRGGVFDRYLRFNEVLSYLNTLVTLRPDLAQTFVAGQSIEGRNIVGIRITGPGAGPKPGILMHGCQHAREWITVPVILWLADQLVRQYDTDPYLRRLVDEREWYLVPVMNPDGYVYTWDVDRMWRKNRRPNAGGCYGVDLNRNWGYGWGGPGSSGDPCSEEYRGTAPFSEPETQAMRNWINSHPNILVYADLHSYSQIIFYPYSYADVWPPQPDLAEYQFVAETMADIVRSVHGLTYTFGRGIDVVYQVSGGSRDWVYGFAQRFAFGCELRDTGTYGFLLPPEQIIPQCEEIAPALFFYADYIGTPQKLITPNGGETLSVGQTVTVRWFTHAPAPADVNLYLSTDGGLTFPYTIVTGETPDGSYTWTVPNLPSTRCRMKLVVNYWGAAPGSDISDADFTITTQTPTLIYSFPLDTNPGWSTQGQWAFGRPTGSGGDPSSGHTGLNVYGYNLSGTYGNNIPRYYLTTTPLNLSGIVGTQLRFWRWLGVDASNFDHASLQVSNDNTNWVTIWDHAGPAIIQSSWTLQSYDISAIADRQPNVRIRWVMGPTNASTAYCGWNIDDIEIWGIQVPQYQPGDLNCDGSINAFDIDPFTLALTDPAGYAAAYPNCDIDLADINADGQVNAFDIDPFVDLLTGR